VSLLTNISNIIFLEKNTYSPPFKPTRNNSQVETITTYNPPLTTVSPIQQYRSKRNQENQATIVGPFLPLDSPPYGSKNGRPSGFQTASATHFTRPIYTRLFLTSLGRTVKHSCLLPCVGALHIHFFKGIRPHKFPCHGHQMLGLV